MYRADCAHARGETQETSNTNANTAEESTRLNMPRIIEQRPWLGKLRTQPVAAIQIEWAACSNFAAKTG
jgi:hypothetical protein